MSELVSRIQHFAGGAAEAEALLRREWLVTNGLGGYASGTVAGVCTRGYHGLLIAASPNLLAEEPFTRRGCVAQAWSVAEVLRCWVQTAKL